MDIKSKVVNNVLYILLSGELDDYSSIYTRDVLDNIIETNKYSSVVFDMSSLQFMDSTGIGVLIGRYKKLKQMHKNSFISHPTKTIEKIFTMSGIYEIMPKIQ